MGMIQKRIASIVSERNKLGELSQRDVARALGCSQASVSYLLKGQRGLSEKWIEKFCELLEITLADLDKTEAPPAEPKPLRELKRKLDYLYEGKGAPAIKCLNSLADLYLDIRHRSIATTNYDRLLEAALKLCKETLPPSAEVQKHPATNVVNGNFPVPSERAADSEKVAEPGITYRDSDAPRLVDVARVPYYDAIPAGDPRAMSPENRIWMEIVHSKAKKTWYTLRVSGDSMSPDYLDGDIVLMDYAQEAHDGDIVAALVDDYESTLKIYSRRGDEITLTPIETRHHSPRTLHASRVAIQGVLVEIAHRVVTRKR